MAKGGFGGMGGMGGMNMNNLMKQAQKMQKQMEEAQASLAEKTIETTSGGGAIKIVITGKKEIQSIKINPEVVDSDDVEMLEDLILSAVNEAVRQAEEMANNTLGKITGGMGNGLF
ncbi:MAG: YbaB/EbfC family nucleoid-associated protein [Anaerotignaceae bacterium]